MNETPISRHQSFLPVDITMTSRAELLDKIRSQSKTIAVLVIVSALMTVLFLGALIFRS